MADEPRAPDAYEAEYMDDDDVVHREKISFPPWFKWFVTIAMSGGIGAAAWGAYQSGDMGSVAALAAMLPVMLFLTTMLSVLRVTVTREHVNIQYGPIGPTIPIDAIEHCEAEDYQFWKYGGYGIRYSVVDGSWCYNMLGDKGKAVRIHYRTESGRLKKLVVASRHHHVLADAINRQRIALGHDVPAELAPDDVEIGVDDEVVFSELSGPGVDASEDQAEAVEDVEQKA
jgi:hypothetical protein